jgi:cytochrome c-type biogenesis protein
MFDIDLFSAPFLVASVIAVLAGAMSFASPCVLPIVPPYVAYMGGISVSEVGQGGRASRRAVGAAMFFVLGLSTVFLVLGFGASAFGRFFLTNRDTFSAVAGVVVMVFGAHFLHVIRIPFLNREARVDAGERGGSAFGAYLLGLAFAAGWTPCIGPMLTPILAMAASEDSIARGTLLLGLYALGLGIPFLLVAAYLPRLTGVVAAMKRNMDRIERIMGLLLWTVGLLMLTGGLSRFSYWLLETFPALALIG